MKAITTRSGVTYEGPSIPINPSLKKVVEQETEETTEEQTNFQGSTAHIPPPVNPIPIPKPDVPKTLPKPNIPYPSRRNDQKSRDKVERISKKRTKNEAKTTKPESEWKSRKKTKSKSKPKPEKVNRKSTQVNPEAKSQEI
ncbi:hypothetical protein Tco_1387773 [Tanacetum coccineum]